MRLDCLSLEDVQKFSAAVRHGEYTGELRDLINLSYPCNLECYTLLPTVKNYEDYGRHLVDTRREFSLSRKARYYFDYEAYGEDTAINEGGDLTPQGYIFNNRTKPFQEIYDGKEIPREYQVFQYPLQIKVNRAHHKRIRDSPIRKCP